MTPKSRFFGYGSLVNSATHDYRDLKPIRASGWARAWRHTALRDVAFLSAVLDPKSEIDGLTAQVEPHDWPALDQREFAYERVALEGHSDTVIYTIPQGEQKEASIKHPILLSYLDVVVQGYLDVFGEEGAAQFFATTHGWEAPILNDRAAPRYPRHQTLTPMQTQFVDDALDALDCLIISA